MIGIAIALFTLLLALIEKPHLFKKPYNGAKIFVLLLLFVTSSFSAWKEFDSDAQQVHDSETIDSLAQLASYQNGQISILSKNVDTFRQETKVAQKSLADSVAAYNRENKSEIKEVAYTMSERFGRTSKTNLEAHQRTQKKLDSVSGVKPAFVHTISEPTNVLRLQYSNDSLTLTTTVQNSGDLPAYKLGGKIYMIVQSGGKLYNLTGREGITCYGATLAAGDRRQYDVGYMLSNETYNKITEFWLVIDFHYYIDYAQRDKRELTKNLIKVKGQGQAQFYPGEIKDVLAEAINGEP